MAAELTILRARASRAADAIGLMVVTDDFEEFMPSCHYARYFSDPSHQPQWGADVVDCWITGFAAFARQAGGGRRICAISAEGDVLHFEDLIFREKIQGAGIQSPDSKFYGRMEDIAGIGDCLFACGRGGQIYMRQSHNVWRCLAPDLLRKPHSKEQFEWFVGIGGPDENDVYFSARNGHIGHWDGNKISVLKTPTQAFLVWVKVESKETVWVGGAEGALLCGNARDGFNQVPGIYPKHHFNSATFFAGKLYVGSSSNTLSGIYILEHGQLLRVRTGLTPEPDDIDMIDAGAGVLWAVGGGKDLIRFDGTTWSRIDLPNNTPIR